MLSPRTWSRSWPSVAVAIGPSLVGLRSILLQRDDDWNRTIPGRPVRATQPIRITRNDCRRHTTTIGVGVESDESIREAAARHHADARTDGDQQRRSERQCSTAAAASEFGPAQRTSRYDRRVANPPPSRYGTLGEASTPGIPEPTAPRTRRQRPALRRR